MNEQIIYREFISSDFEPLFTMAMKLWKAVKEVELKGFLTEAINSENQKVWIAKNTREILVGFAVFSIRRDYVEGAIKSPTGYLEGIYVESNYRKKGIAKEFIRLGERWCKSNDCIQIGSDTWLTDTSSRYFHKKIGFWEEDELVHFLKNIDKP